MNIIKKTFAYVSTFALLGGTMAPGALAQGTTISGNGALSTSIVTQSDTETNTTVQNNSATFNNTIDVASNTGGNVADYNTGGNVGIGTGNSVTGVQITNMANLNVANTSPSSSSYVSPELPVTIQGNGAGSANTFSSTETQDQTLYQTNTAAFNNAVGVSSNTGDNSATYGTNGNTTILTGYSQTGIGIQNTANGNYASGSLPVANSLSLNGVGTTSGTAIVNNGALSSNSVAINNTDSSLTVQNNDAVINNSVAVAAATGANFADQNTGGSQLIQTGMATITAGINNLANFNYASLPNGSWVSSADPLIYGNGAYSGNVVDLSQSRTNTLYQGDGEGGGNEFAVNNALVFSPTTGENGASLNTLKNGFSHVLSGPSATSVSVNNSGNVNNAGSLLGSFTLPNGTVLNLGFNLGSMFQL